MTRIEFEKCYPEDAKRLRSGDPDYVLPGGESLPQIFNRHIEAAEEIARNNEGKNILIVGHGGVLKSFFHKATNTPLAGPRR